MFPDRVSAVAPRRRITKSRRPFDARERARRSRRWQEGAPEFFSPTSPSPPNFRRASTRSAGLSSRRRSRATPSDAERVADLRALARLLTENQAAIVAAIDADCGGRSGFETMFGEIFASLDGLRDARKRLAPWMRPRRRSVDALLYPGARNRLIPQPLGAPPLAWPRHRERFV
jgi:hypothetical protein